MAKFGRLEIPKSERELQQISERIMEEHGEEEVFEEEHGGHEYRREGAGDTAAILNAIAHQMVHIEGAIAYLAQAMREIRDSIDDLQLVMRDMLRLQLALAIGDEKEKQRILKELAEELSE